MLDKKNATVDGAGVPSAGLNTHTGSQNQKNTRGATPPLPKKKKKMRWGSVEIVRYFLGYRRC